MHYYNKKQIISLSFAEIDLSAVEIFSGRHYFKGSK